MYPPRSDLSPPETPAKVVDISSYQLTTIRSLSLLLRHWWTALPKKGGTLRSLIEHRNNHFLNLHQYQILPPAASVLQKISLGTSNDRTNPFLSLKAALHLKESLFSLP